jgi:transposase-like protein
MEIVRRVLDGERVSALSQELGIHRKVLHEWVRRVRDGGESNLRDRGRPRKGDTPTGDADTPRRVAELERIVGRQQLAIQFFKCALQQVEELRLMRSTIGAAASSKPSRQ